MTAEIPENLKTVIEHTVRGYLKGGERFDLDVGDLHLRINIKGPAWEGIVDRTLGKFVVDLDKAVTDELKKHGLDFTESPHGLVALQVDDGSLEACLKFAKDFLPKWKQMKPAEKVLLVVALLAALGTWQSPEIIEQLQKAKVAQVEAAKDVQIAEATAKGNEAVIEAVVKVIDSTRELQSPIRGLVKNLEPEDRISLPGHEKPLKKEEVKEVLVKGTRSKSSKFFIDGRYIVEGLTTKDPGQWEIVLVWGEVTFKAKLELTDAQVSQLMASFRQAHQSGTNIAPDLQVTAEINANGIQSALVIGIGDRRQDSMTLGEVMQRIKDGGERTAAVSQGAVEEE
jgi:hypothetical protein